MWKSFGKENWGCIGGPQPNSSFQFYKPLCAHKMRSSRKIRHYPSSSQSASQKSGAAKGALGVKIAIMASYEIPGHKLPQHWLHFTTFSTYAQWEGLVSRKAQDYKSASIKDRGLLINCNNWIIFYFYLETGICPIFSKTCSWRISFSRLVAKKFSFLRLAPHL